MRTLRFIADGQKLTRDPACDFGGLVAGSSGYLQAAFDLSGDWAGCAVAASFFSQDGRETAVPVQGGRCTIPKEALGGQLFAVRLTGQRAGMRIKTNKIYLRQEAG